MSPANLLARHRDWYLVTREFQTDFLYAALNGHLPRFLDDHKEVLEKIAKKLKKVNIESGIPVPAYICKNFLDILNEFHTPKMPEPDNEEEWTLWMAIRRVKTRRHWNELFFWFEFNFDQVLKYAYLQRILGVMIEGNYRHRYFFLSDTRSDYHRVENSYKEKKLVKLTSNLQQRIEQENVELETKDQQEVEERKRLREEEKERMIRVKDQFGREFLETQESTGEAGKASRALKIQKLLGDHRTVVFSSEILNSEQSEKTLKGLKALGTEYFLVNVDEDLDVRVGIQVRRERIPEKKETLQEFTGHHDFPQVLMGVEKDSERDEASGEAKAAEGAGDETDKQ